MADRRFLRRVTAVAGLAALVAPGCSSDEADRGDGRVWPDGQATIHPDADVTTWPPGPDIPDLGDCADEPYLAPLPTPDENCSVPSATEGCKSAAGTAGFRECRWWAEGDDNRWTACFEACTEEEAGRAADRACQAGGRAGIQYCDTFDLWDGEWSYVWSPCLDPDCLECAPGDKVRCGGGHAYPSLEVPCLLWNGIPRFHVGDCDT